MNHYPLWKYLIIVALLVTGLVYTLPNFYGESPAVQVIPLRAGNKADNNLLQRVESALKVAGLQAQAISLDVTVSRHVLAILIFS